MVMLILCTTRLTKNESSLVAGNTEDSFYEPQGDVDDYVYCYRYAKYFAAPNTKMFNIIKDYMYSWLFRPRQILNDNRYLTRSK